MGGKADKLQIGAKKTGRGLFADMQSLKGREEAASTDDKIANDIVAAKEATKEVNKSESAIEETKKGDDILSVIMEPEPDELPVERETKKEEPVVEEPADIIKEIKSEINKKEEKAKKEPDKAASRYEKDKFLLLDIRGYRDYVEHMSKAANMSATKYIRGLIEKDMEKNKDIYDAHKKLEQMLMNRTAGQQ